MGFWARNSSKDHREILDGLLARFKIYGFKIEEWREDLDQGMINKNSPPLNRELCEKTLRMIMRKRGSPLEWYKIQLLKWRAEFKEEEKEKESSGITIGDALKKKLGRD